MVTRIYSCSLCNSQYKPEELHGIRWGSRDNLEKHTSRQCETHLCQACLDGVTAIGNEYAAMRPVMPATPTGE